MDPDIRCVTLPTADSDSANSPDACEFNTIFYRASCPPAVALWSYAFVGTHEPAIRPRPVRRTRHIRAARSRLSLRSSQIRDDRDAGHQRLEATAGWGVLQDVFERLTGSPFPTVTPLSLARILLALPITLFAARYERRRGRELGSDVLQADATRTQINVVASLAALIGLLGSSIRLKSAGNLSIMLDNLHRLGEAYARSSQRL